MLRRSLRVCIRTPEPSPPHRDPVDRATFTALGAIDTRNGPKSTLRRSANREERSNVSKWLRLIVLISFMVAIRLPGINEPVSGWHAWRQADTAAIARNFAEEDMNILHPRVDWRGETAGQIESEFPIVSWASAALIRLGSPENAALRLPSIVTSVLGVLAVLALGSRWCGPRVGWIAALTYGLLPFGVYFGRVPMPEVTMLAASAGGLLFADVWATDRKLGSLIAATACLALAALLKLPTLYMGLPLIAVFVVRGRPGVFRDVRPWIAAVRAVGVGGFNSLSVTDCYWRA